MSRLDRVRNAVQHKLRLESVKRKLFTEAELEEWENTRRKGREGALDARAARTRSRTDMERKRRQLFGGSSDRHAKSLRDEI